MQTFTNDISTRIPRAFHDAFPRWNNRGTPCFHSVPLWFPLFSTRFHYFPRAFHDYPRCSTIIHYVPRLSARAHGIVHFHAAPRLKIKDFFRNSGNRAWKIVDCAWKIVDCAWKIVEIQCGNVVGKVAGFDEIYRGEYSDA